MRRPGFSLLEVLVSISVVVLLLSIAIPVGLSALMDRSDAAVSLSRLREHLAMFYLYASDNDGFVPSPIPAGPDPSIIGDLWWVSEREYFHQSWSWSLVLAGPYYNGQHSAAYFSPLELERGYERYRMAPLKTDFQMSCSFLAGPEFYNPETRRRGLAQLGPRRLSEVLFSSDKVLLSSGHWAPWEPLATTLVDKQRIVYAAWADGSAERNPAGGGLVMNSGDGADAKAMAGGHDPSYGFGTHTLDGVRGTDR
ncbi:MAG: prepilin-type N-terminal cleavage/methylation domain-containing protein [Planctomycetota bacterium]